MARIVSFPAPPGYQSHWEWPGKLGNRLRCRLSATCCTDPGLPNLRIRGHREFSRAYLARIACGTTSRRFGVKGIVWPNQVTYKDGVSTLRGMFHRF